MVLVFGSRCLEGTEKSTFCSSQLLVRFASTVQARLTPLLQSNCSFLLVAVKPVLML